jgi:hypothetical protein
MIGRIPTMAPLTLLTLREVARRRLRKPGSRQLGRRKKTNEMLPHEYARSALKIGLQIEERPGVNPFKFETIASGLEGVPPTQQERAYTSPIWYTP